MAEASSQTADENRSVIDMSKMNEGQRAALQVTEAARESHDDISFVANLFMGKFRPEKLYPITEVDAEEKALADLLTQ
jgi:predicted acetyltransferase